MIQESHGAIAHRTREHLTATDAAIVRFRRTVLAAAKALANGDPPQAPRLHDRYRLRSGRWSAREGSAFEELLKESLGDPIRQVAACKPFTPGQTTRVGTCGYAPKPTETTNTQPKQKI